MPVPSSEIERLIKQGIPDAKVEITDLAGDNNHYAAVVVSSEFAGKSKLQQHQIVYRALGETMGGALHALQLQTLAPKEASQNLPHEDRYPKGPGNAYEG